ncbi:MAG: DUF1501 domain-containing protein, partial [Pirellulales bacterium]|nr:DUF1501 domain-containing protein [Pirellulales bacterium]
MTMLPDGSLLTRRNMLKTGTSGLGYLALSSLLTQEAAAAKAGAPAGPLAPKAPHFEPKAKRVIMLFMQGGPSHVDTFDYKPELQKHQDQEYQTSDQKVRGKLLPSPW